jgi:predicted TIM-barrel fold metal-dependent hydrolase
MLDELKRCFAEENMVGIKLHPYCHERSLSYKNYRVAYEFANEWRLPVMSHTYTAEDVDATDRLAAEYPDAVFIMAHTGGEGYNIEKALAVAKKHENVYGDIAVSQSMEGRIEYFTKEITAKKFLFGTDTACMSPVATLAMVAMAEISEDEKKDILGLNMRRILDRKRV